MTDAGAREHRFEPAGPGPWKNDPVHFPRPVTRYWTETHPDAFAAGTSTFARYYGLLIDGLFTSYVNGFAYNQVRPAPEEEMPARFARADEVLARKLWREQLREWDEEEKPAAMAKHREIQAVDPASLSDDELVEHLRRCRDHHVAMITQHMTFTAGAVIPAHDFVAHEATERIADGKLFLSQCRAVTTSTKEKAAIDPTLVVAENPAKALPDVPPFAESSEEQVEQIAAPFKARKFVAGETVIREGTAGAAFYLIDSGEAKVTIRGEEVGKLGRGDHFGEIALIEGGQRLATVTATTDLVCHGLTFWEFGPLVQHNGALGWKLLQSLEKILRGAEQVKPGDPS
jgi:hypothetical protein